MIKILIIGSGGFLGAILRYFASGYAQSLSGSYSFPVGTLAVNLIGCFIIGAVSKLAEDLGSIFHRNPFVSDNWLFRGIHDLFDFRI